MRSILSFIAAALFSAPGLVCGEAELPPILAGLALDRNEAFVKEQILVTIRVGYPPGAFGMTQSTLQVDNAELFSLHKSEFVEKYRDQPYRFVETRYALFGNAVGEIKLSGININATLPVSSGGTNSTGNPAIEAFIDPRSIQIRAIPVESFPAKSDRWLAASQVVISSDWSAIEAALNPGIPLTRQVIIKVSGQHPAAVSEKIALDLPDGLRAYPAPAITTVDKTPDGLSGSVVLPVTIVASDSGDFALPEISLPWWDINKRQWRFATLAAEKLDIMSADGGDKAAGYRFAIAALALLAAGLGLLSYVLWRRVPRPRYKEPSAPSEKIAWRQIKKLEKNGSDNQFRQAVAAWSREISPQDAYTGLDDFSDRYPPLKILVDRLNKRLYAQDFSVDLDRRQLMQVLVGVRREILREAKHSKVDNTLYPRSIS